MRKYLFGFLLLIPLLLAACGASATANGGGGGAAPAATATGHAAGATVNMSETNFAPNNSAVTISAGQSVTFVSQGLHMLVTGTNGTLTTEAGAPAVLSTSAGMEIQAGDTKSVLFPTAGKYMITCTIHPYMELSVTVTA